MSSYKFNSHATSDDVLSPQSALERIAAPSLSEPASGTAVPAGLKIERWLHGGATISIERTDGTLERVLDIHDSAPGVRRERIIAALLAAGVLDRD